MATLQIDDGKKQKVRQGDMGCFLHCSADPTPLTVYLENLIRESF